MERRAWFVAAAAAAGFLLWPAGAAVSQSIQEVFVTNWPAVQAIEGTVRLDGPVRLSETVRRTDLVVAPVGPRDTTRLVEAGAIDVAGFGHVTLSLFGITKGEVGRSGTVGAILIPDQETVVQAFHERGETLFALEVLAAGVSAASPYFASTQPRLQVGFPRYRVYLYNTSDKTTDVELVAYLTP